MKVDNMVGYDNILVSVIVPVYNVESYLDACLSQLAKQKLKNIEVIIIDDGSTDGSLDIAMRYVKMYPNFYLIHQENSGLSASRNRGLEKAKGKYIYFCDSDDYIFENTLEDLYCKAEEENLDVIRFLAYEFDDENESQFRLSSYTYRVDYQWIYDGRELFKLMINNGDNIPSACLLFTKREIIEKNNLRFKEGIIHEDNLFNFLLMHSSKRVFIWNNPLYCRRIRKNSITRNINYFEAFRGFMITEIEVEGYMERYAMSNEKALKKYIYILIMTAFDYLLNMPPKDRERLFLLQKELVTKMRNNIISNKFYGSVRLFFFSCNPTKYLKVYDLLKKKRRENECK